MTALALGRSGPQPAAEPARALAALREPYPLSIAVLLALGVLVGARHPLTQLLGTAAPAGTAVTPVAAAPLPVAPPVVAPAPSPAPVVALHAPRDPFAAVVSAGAGPTSVPVAAPAPAAVAPVPGPATPAPGAAVHVVAAGESLWSIAAARLGPGATSAQVSALVRRLYTLNAAAVGADPDRLLVGTRLHLA